MVVPEQGPPHGGGQGIEEFGEALVDLIFFASAFLLRGGQQIQWTEHGMSRGIFDVHIDGRGIEVAMTQ